MQVFLVQGGAGSSDELGLFPLTLTFHVWFFACEVPHHGLQLTQLAVSWVNVCLTVGPASTRNLQTSVPRQKCGNIAYLATEPTIRWLLSDPNPISRGDLRRIEEGQTWGHKRKETKMERTPTLLNRDIPSEDILSISSSQNNTQTVNNKENTVVFLLL